MNDPRQRRLALAVAVALMDGAGAALRRVSPTTRYRLTDTIARPVAAALLRRRPAIAANYGAVLGVDAEDPRARGLARASMRNYGRMAADFLTLRSMSAREILTWVDPVHEERFSAAIGEGRGVILALPHLGSWDVAAAFAHAYGITLTVITEHDWTARLVAGSRSAQGITLVPRDGSLRVIYRALARNECVAILCDSAPEGVQRIHVPFFGRPAAFPAGPARLAHRTGAAILPICCVRRRGGRYRIEVSPPIHADRKAPVEDTVREVTAALAAAFERIVRAYPEHWYAYRAVWE